MLKITTAKRDEVLAEIRTHLSTYKATKVKNLSSAQIRALIMSRNFLRAAVGDLPKPETEEEEQEGVSL